MPHLHPNPLVAKTHTLGGQGSPFINTTCLHSKKGGEEAAIFPNQEPAKTHRTKTYNIAANSQSKTCKPFHNIVPESIFINNNYGLNKQPRQTQQ